MATALRMAAVGVADTDTWLGSHHRRMRARLGPAGANTATARKIATIVYHLLKPKSPLLIATYSPMKRAYIDTNLHASKKQAKALGYELVETTEQKQLAE